MKYVVFAHDHSFVRDGESYYSYGSYPENYWERYLKHVPSVAVVAKEDSVGLKSGLVFSFGDSDTICAHLHQKVPVFWRAGLFYGKQAYYLESLIKGASWVVARLPSELGLASLAIARKYGIPTAVEVVGCAYDAYKYRGGAYSKLYSSLAFIRMVSAVKQADASLYVSKWLQERYPSSSSAVQSIASNVVLSNFQSGLAFIGSKAGPKEGTVRIGLIGSYYVRYKGIDVAIRALNEVLKSGVDAHLHVLGDGDKTDYEELANSLNISSRVHFDALRPAGEPVRDWLRELNLYIQPSLTEGLPRGLLEAMSMGLPCCGSSAGGIPELLPDERIHTPGDFGELSRHILEVLSQEPCESAARNINKAREYSSEILDNVRDVHYSAFFGGIK